jgi:hypothetical protein
MCTGNLLTSYGQTVEKIKLGLNESGFENIRVMPKQDKYIISIENQTHRSEARAISEALNQISSVLEQAETIDLLLLKNQTPQYMIRVKSADWKKFRSGELSKEELSNRLQVSRTIGESWDDLKSLDAEHTRFSKFQLLLYPQFSYENRLLAKMYEIQLNVAPLLSIAIRKGMQFNGQLIFPIYNELGYEGNFIRPGFVSISQDYRIAQRWYGQIAAGNFNSARYGFESHISHNFRNENWNLELYTGYTGSSHYFDRTWIHSKINTLTWSGSVSYFISKFNLECKVGAAQYVYQDQGIFASCTRHFHETSVGFYAQIGKENNNGGFYFRVPFPTSRRKNHKKFRISLPEHYNFTMNAGTEFYYGQEFETKPGESKFRSPVFTEFIKNEILTLNNK